MELALPSSDYVWSQQQFDEMSWHDNHVHALRFAEGKHGAGELVLDLDYILEWICGVDGGFQFLLLPATLTFREVTNLRLTLDYATPTAALGPFSIHAIERRTEQRERYVAQLWTISINWPSGEITFEAPGYDQRGVGAPAISTAQCLPAAQRPRSG
jgi:hypothetical protein